MTTDDAPVRIVEQKTVAAAAKRVREASVAPTAPTSSSVFDFVVSVDSSSLSQPTSKKDETQSKTIEVTSVLPNPVKGKTGSGASTSRQTASISASVSPEQLETPLVIRRACDAINKGKIQDLIAMWTPELTSITNSLISTNNETISPLHLSLQKFFWEGAAFLIAAGCKLSQLQRVYPIHGDGSMLESDERLKEPVSALYLFSTLLSVSSTESASSKRGKALKALKPIFQSHTDGDSNVSRLVAVDVIRRLSLELEKKKKELPASLSRAIPELAADYAHITRDVPTQKSRLSIREPSVVQPAKKTSELLLDQSNQQTVDTVKVNIVDTKGEDSDSLPDIDIEELVVTRVSTEAPVVDASIEKVSVELAEITHVSNAAISINIEPKPQPAAKVSVEETADVIMAIELPNVLEYAPHTQSLLPSEDKVMQEIVPPTPLVSQLSAPPISSSSSAIRSLGAAQAEKARQDDAERERERKREKIRAEIEARKAATKAGGNSSSGILATETTSNSNIVHPDHVHEVPTSAHIVSSSSLLAPSNPPHKSVAEEAEAKRRAEEDARRQALELAAAEKARAVAAEVQGARAKALQAVGPSLSANFSSSSQATKNLSLHSSLVIPVPNNAHVQESLENLQPRVMSPRSVNIQQTQLEKKQIVEAPILSPNRQLVPLAAPIPILLPSGLKAGDNDNYAMSDREGSSGDDDEEEDGTSRPKKPVPDWAKGPALEAAIHAQYGDSGTGGFADPDRIFEEITSCDLEEVFSKNAKKKRFTKRTSSGNWLPDKLTHGERSQYRKDMGWDK
jgi:hypothetical protein